MRTQALIVDDSSLARRAARPVLEELGFTVEEARDAISGLERVSLNHPELVLLDLLMPGMDGLEAVTMLRELAPELKVIVVTSDVQSETRSAAYAAGASAFLNKPLSRSELRRTVKSILEAH